MAVLVITERAGEAIRTILEAPQVPQGAGLRIYAEAVDDERSSLELAVTEGPAGSDQVFEQAGARIFLDPQAALYLDDKVIDAEVEQGQVRLSIALQDEGPGLS